MATSHHGNEMPSDFLKQFLMTTPPANGREEGAALRRYLEQARGEAKRAYPQGRVSGEDDGELAMAVTSDPTKGIVVIDFGKPVTWMGLRPDDVTGLIRLLEHHLAALTLTPADEALLRKIESGQIPCKAVEGM